MSGTVLPITFIFEDKNYLVGQNAYDINLIQLPDGRILLVEGWQESMPPKPISMKVVTLPKASLMGKKKGS